MKQGEQDLAVAAALELIAFFRQLPFQGTEAVDLAVAHHVAAVQRKRLHSFGMQSHNGQAVKTQKSRSRLYNPAVIGAAG